MTTTITLKTPQFQLDRARRCVQVDRGAIFVALAGAAARAGATGIYFRNVDDGFEFEADAAPRLALTDLLTVGSWSLFNPYNQALLAALHACRHIEIEITGQRIAAGTEELLRRDPVTVTSGSRPKGAWMRLTGGSDRLVLGGFGDWTPAGKAGATGGDIHVSRANQMFYGFPIPVFVDGMETVRTCAEGPEFQPCEVGVFAVLDDQLEEGPYMPPEIYLNGFRVHVATVSAPSGTVIHLDPEQFHADPADHRRVMESDCESRVADVLTELVIQGVQQISVQDPDLVWRPLLRRTGRSLGHLPGRTRDSNSD